MTNENYYKMVELLKSTTASGKLSWEFNAINGSFSTVINECRIELHVYYSAPVNDSIASLELFNQNGQSFVTYSYYSQDEEDDYNELKSLEEIVRDRYYKITESENLIIGGLENL